MKAPILAEQFLNAVEYQVKHYCAGVEPDVLRASVMEDATSMIMMGIDPAYIYAFCKTGLVVVNLGDGKTNIDWRPKKDKDEFYQAMEEFNFVNDPELQ